MVKENELVPVDKSVTAMQVPSEEKALIPDEKMVSYFEDAMQCIKEDRDEANNRYLEFADLCVNGGDPSSATKEAMVNLLKIKSDGVVQMTRILDLWTRLKLKEKATSSQIYAYQQNNRFESASTSNKQVRELIKLAQQVEEV